MKGKKIIAVLLAALLTTAVFAMAGCDVSNNKVRFSVTFEPNNGGGGANFRVFVYDGDLVAEPNEPEMIGYDFSGWYNGDAIYRFTTPVTANITLKAKWDKKKFNVKFMSDGVVYSQETVEYGDAVAAPSVPEKTDYYFAGWMFEGEKYDFSTEITENKEISAKWISNASIEADITAALAADYGNYTSVRTVTETDGEGLSYTVTYKRTATDSYSKQVQDGLPDETRYAVFDAQGAALGGYYKRGDSNWSKYNPIALYYYLPMKLNNAVAADFVFNGESYDVIDESLTAIEYSVFGTTNDMQSLSFYVSDGKISKITGKFTTENMELVQTFTDIGATQLTRPELPAATVNITKKNKEIDVGIPVDKNELIEFLFTVKIEDKDYDITPEMVDFGTFDFDNPQVGTYTVTITFDTWDGVTHTDTTTITVSTPAAETFAQIFAKDYTNVTFSGSANGKYVNGVYSIPNAFCYVEADGTLTKYHSTSFAETKNAWQALPRFDMLFALDVDIFMQVGETNEYTVVNDSAILDVISKTAILKTYVVNTKRDYSITLTVSAGHITKASFSYYYVTGSTSPTASNGTLRTVNYEFSDFGTTEFTIPDEITAKRTD